MISKLENITNNIYDSFIKDLKYINYQYVEPFFRPLNERLNQFRYCRVEYCSDRKSIERWLNKMKIKNYIINDDLSVDVDGFVNLRHKNLNNFPVRFAVINGDFFCSHNNLHSLVNGPTTVIGWFCCLDNKLKSLDHRPEVVNGRCLFDRYLKDPLW